MKRSWNKLIWVGFLLVLAGLLSYIPLFVRFPITRDFPWVNLLMLAVGLAMLGAGLARAFRKPQVYRGRVFGTIFAVLAVAGSALFCWGVLYAARDLPGSAAAPRVGQQAPDFTLPDQDGRPVALRDLLAASSDKPGGGGRGGGGGVLLIFYRGYW
jgi:hypothetical protein